MDDDTVLALELFDGDILAGGGFTLSDGELVNRVARWDGAAWQPLGAGVDGSVFDLLAYDGDLVAGGLFVTAGGTPARRIAGWDGDG